MWKNYFKTAIRSFYKNINVTLINLIGLVVAFTVCLLISMYVYKQLSFDKFNENYSDIYRLELKGWAELPSGVSPRIKENFPEIEKVTRIAVSWWKNVFNYNNDLYSVKDLIYSDNDFFDIFSINIIAGNKEELLKNPFSIVLTEDLAKKIFKDENPIGKTVKFNNNYFFTVTGIIESRDDFHLKYNAIADFTSLKDLRGKGDENFLTSLGPRNYLVYLLNRNISKFNLENKINKFFMNKGSWNNDNPPSFWLRNFSNIYLNNDAVHEVGCIHGNKKVVTAFIVIAFFVLIIACINYINITTARGMSRFKEIGVRKVVGSGRLKVFTQFIIESILLCLFAFAISLFIVFLVSKQLFMYLISNEMTLLHLPINLIIAIVVLMILVGIIAALYPSLLLSAISPLKLFKQKNHNIGNKSYLRQALIITQFSISIVLIIGAIIVNKQYNFMKDARLGFNPNQIVTLHFEKDIRGSMETMKAKFLQNPNILNVASSQQIPGNLRSTSTYYKDDIKQEYRYEYIDPNYVSLLELDMVKGRNISWDRKGDYINSWLINETAVEKFQLNPDSVIGTKIRAYGQDYNVVGVVKDYHFNSLHEEIVPLVMSWHNGGLTKLNVKISTQNISETLTYINNVWNEFAIGYPFEYEFVDQKFSETYNQEEKLSTMFTIFALLAIIIAVIGIYGLASYMAEQYTRQISIRKVYGATIGGVVQRFSKEFLILIIAANAIAWPISYYIMNIWLQKFPYKTDVSYSIFLVSGLISVLISLLTVSYHAYKTANRNPAEVLRYE